MLLLRMEGGGLEVRRRIGNHSDADSELLAGRPGRRQLSGMGWG
jgi:hypothetical protein